MSSVFSFIRRFDRARRGSTALRVDAMPDCARLRTTVGSANMNFKRWLPLGLFLLLALAAALIGGLATDSGIGSWYSTLRKPEWAPAHWIFSPLWALLSASMAVATWRVWRKGAVAPARRTVSLYSAQLTLDVLWSILFFGLHRPGAALLEIVLLWAVSILILLRFRKTDRIAAMLWTPGVAWSGFIAVFNTAIWWLNR